MNYYNLKAKNLKLKTLTVLRNAVSVLLTVIVSQTIMAQDTRENVDCSFNTPRNSPMPIMNYRSYNTDPNFVGSITVIGKNGPDLSSFRKLDIAYTNNQLVTFFYQSSSTNTFPSIDLLPNTVQNFNQSNPEITLLNTGIDNFDGSYFVNVIDNGLGIDFYDFVMVSKTGDFAIYFSNLDTAPSCVKETPNFIYDEGIDGELSLDNNTPTLINFVPGNNNVISTQEKDQANFFTFQIPEGYELSQLNVDDYKGSDDIGFIGINEGSSITTAPPRFIGGLSYGAANIGTDILPILGDASNPAALFITGFGFTPPLKAKQYTVWLNQTGMNSTSTLNFVITAIEENLSIVNNKIENNVVLKQNYPNPFKDLTTIEYRLKERSTVKLEVYNLQGQLVKSLDKGVQNSGNHKLVFGLNQMNSGVYVAVLITKKGNQKQLIVLEN